MKVFLLILIPFLIYALITVLFDLFKCEECGTHKKVRLEPYYRFGFGPFKKMICKECFERENEIEY